MKTESVKKIPRRVFLMSVVATALASGYVANRRSNNYMGKALDKAMYGEHLSITKIKQDMIFGNKGDPIRERVPIHYVEFRDSIFQLYPIKAEQNDNVGKLVERAHSTYNPGIPLKSHELQRAVDLFNFLHENPHTLDRVVENEIKSVQYQSAKTPGIQPIERYTVPVLRNYKSLEDLMPKKIDTRKTI